MATQIADPTTPASKPHGTTDDQVREMENEGQAQAQGAPGPVATPDPDEATPREVPGDTGSGDTGSGDIVGRTGEQMPRQSHDGLEADSRKTVSS